jgi:hypothetical protein
MRKGSLVWWRPRLRIASDFQQSKPTAELTNSPFSNSHQLWDHVLIVRTLGLSCNFKRHTCSQFYSEWRTRHDSNVWPSPSEGDALSS